MGSTLLYRYLFFPSCSFISVFHEFMWSSSLYGNKFIELFAHDLSLLGPVWVGQVLGLLSDMTSYPPTISVLLLNGSRPSFRSWLVWGLSPCILHGTSRFMISPE